MTDVPTTRVEAIVRLKSPGFKPFSLIIIYRASNPDVRIHLYQNLHNSLGLQMSKPANEQLSPF